MVRSSHGDGRCSVNTLISEARLEFELACNLRKEEATLVNLANAYVKEILPQMADNNVRIKHLGMMCSICNKARAPCAVVHIFCSATLALLPDNKGPEHIALMADLHMLRIVRANEERYVVFALDKSDYVLAFTHCFSKSTLYILTLSRESSACSWGRYDHTCRCSFLLFVPFFRTIQREDACLCHGQTVR
jgi:hypothetical protein